MQKSYVLLYDTGFGVKQGFDVDFCPGNVAYPVKRPPPGEPRLSTV